MHIQVIQISLATAINNNNLGCKFMQIDESKMWRAGQQQRYANDKTATLDMCKSLNKTIL